MSPREHVAGLGMTPFPGRAAPSLVAASLALGPCCLQLLSRDSYAIFRKITGVNAEIDYSNA